MNRLRVNLIPRQRRLARARRMRRRWWVGLCCAWGLLLACACAGIGMHLGADSQGLAQDLARTRQEIGDFDRSLREINQRTLAAHRRLEAAREASMHADWSVLLALLAHELGADTVLRECRLYAADPPAPTAAAQLVRGSVRSGVPPTTTDSASAGRYQLELAGLGRSQASASQFVLHLQQTGLFDDVKLVRTSREPFLDGQAVAFHILCTLGPRDSARSSHP